MGCRVRPFADFLEPTKRGRLSPVAVLSPSQLSLSKWLRAQMNPCFLKELVMVLVSNERVPGLFHEVSVDLIVPYRTPHCVVVGM